MGAARASGRRSPCRSPARPSPRSPADLRAVLERLHQPAPLSEVREPLHARRSASAMLQQLDATNWPLLMAGAVVMMLPVLLLLFLVQRAFWPDGGRGARSGAERASAGAWPRAGAALLAPRRPPPSRRAAADLVHGLRRPRREGRLRASSSPSSRGSTRRSRSRSSTSPGRATTASGWASTSPPARRPTSCCSTTAATAPSPPGACSSRSGPTSSAEPGDRGGGLLSARRWSRSAGRARSCASRRTSRAWSSTTTATSSSAPASPARPSDWTWDDFLHAARALTRDTDGDGRIDQYGLGTEVSIFRLAPFVWQNGGELVDDPRAPTRLTLDSAARRARPCSGSSTCSSSTRWCPTRSRRRPRAARAAS